MKKWLGAMMLIMATIVFTASISTLLPNHISHFHIILWIASGALAAAGGYLIFISWEGNDD